MLLIVKGSNGYTRYSTAVYVEDCIICVSGTTGCLGFRQPVAQEIRSSRRDDWSCQRPPM